MAQPDIGALRADCRSGDPDRQIPALIELIKIHDEPSLPDITPLLTSSEEQVRAEAARAVGYLGSAQASSLGPLLLSLLSDSDEMVRNEAVEALGLIIYPPASTALKDILKHDPSWLMRASAAEALGGYSDPTVLTALENVLHDVNEVAEVQMYAASSLGRVADATFLPSLDVLIAGGTWELRVQAALLAAGYRLGGQKYLDPLLDLLKNASESESWTLLNQLQDVVESGQPPTLQADSAQIRAALRATASRWPLTAQQVQQIERKLPSP